MHVLPRPDRRASYRQPKRACTACGLTAPVNATIRTNFTIAFRCAMCGEILTRDTPHAAPHGSLTAAGTSVGVRVARRA